MSERPIFREQQSIGQENRAEALPEDFIGNPSKEKEVDESSLYYQFHMNDVWSYGHGQRGPDDETQRAFREIGREYEAVISEDIEQMFLQLRERIKTLTLGELEVELLEKYAGDEEAIALIRSKFELDHVYLEAVAVIDEFGRDASIDEIEKTLKAGFSRSWPVLRTAMSALKHTISGERKINALDLTFNDPRLVNSFLGGLDRAGELYMLGSLCKRSQLSLENTPEELRKLLSGKKVLILGDDTGTMSQVLNKYGAEATGLEYDGFKVLIAHSGILSENQQPQLQVIQGDIHDLGNQDGELYKQLAARGPFDIITSQAVFNLGSGFDDGLKSDDVDGGWYSSYWDHLRDLSRLNPVERKITNMHNGLNELLGPEGFQAHFNIDMEEMFTPKHTYFCYSVDNISRTAILPRFAAKAEDAFVSIRNNPNLRR